MYIFPRGGFVYDLYSFAGNIFSVITPRASFLSHGELVFGVPKFASPDNPTFFFLGPPTFGDLGCRLINFKILAGPILPCDTAFTIKR